MKIKILINSISVCFIIIILFACIKKRGYAQQLITAKLSVYPVFYSGKCPITIKFKGQITVTRPGKVQYKFIRSDGALSPVKTLIFKSAGTKEVNTTWTLGGSTLHTYYGWIAIKIIYPQELESNKAHFRIKCIQTESKLPDLTIEDLSLNRNCQVVVKVKNNGPGMVPDTVWTHHHPKNAGIYLYINGKKWGGATIPYFDPLKSLQHPGGIAKYISKLKISNSAVITAKVDLWNVVKEVNENNNKKTKRLICKATLLKDVDKDGISDKLELELLRRFRPYYKFTKGEHYPPTDAVYQVRYAQLKKGDWLEGWKEPGNVHECGDKRDSWHVNPPNRLLYCLNGKLNLLKNPVKTGYYLNINDGKRKDPGNGRKMDWNYAISHAPGLYGHVVRSGKYIKIEYWQYFAYNGQDLHGVDHEGDWATVQLWYDPKSDKLIKTCHWAHGKGFCFHLNKTIKKRIITRPDWNFYFIKYLGPNYGKPLPEIKFEDKSRFPKNYQDNVVEFYVKKKEPKNLHIVVYIEKDAHEFWPFSVGSYQWANKHTGDGISYLTAFWPDKINLGELTHPMPNSMRDKFKNSKEIILRFNGYWGAWHHKFNNPPPGPTLHCQWTFSENERVLAQKIKKYCEH
ncbi:hypothetical protein DRN73_10015 [Candidatus Pacearchaeota archaeon]|nr:MAG: hypothetical protein DRN73_10015 [Candidatus Pacearchaeota archaeon]